MDLALARKTGQELHNDYVLTSSPVFGSLRKFFRAAIRELVHAYLDYPRPYVNTRAVLSVCDRMRRDISDSSQGPSRTSPVDQVEDIPVVESLSPLILSSATPPPPPVETPVRSLIPNNRSLGLLQTGPGEHAHLHLPQSRGAVVCRWAPTSWSRISRRCSYNLKENVKFYHILLGCGRGAVPRTLTERDWSRWWYIGMSRYFFLHTRALAGRGTKGTSPWARYRSPAPPPPSMSGIILFRGMIRIRIEVFPLIY